MTNLKLTKTLAFLDVESTGLSPSLDKVIELGIVWLKPDGTTSEKIWRFNPGRQLDEKIIALTGITNADLEHEPSFRNVAKQIVDTLKDCDLAGFNLYKLDLPMLMEEFLNADVEFNIDNRKVIDVMRIFHTMEKRTLSAAYKFYCNKEADNAHNALVDSRMTLEVLESQLQFYPELGDNLVQINDVIGNPETNIVDLVGRMVYDDKGEVTFNFGKYRGQSVKEVLKRDPSFYSWMMNGDFTQYTKKKLTEIRLSLK
ncbi:MAG: exonuclease domain-containing protein [Bacteroidota bacterium]|nr:exonuclease domain-containing protein [Bacteroidota bacterium]